MSNAEVALLPFREGKKVYCTVQDGRSSVCVCVGGGTQKIHVIYIRNQHTCTSDTSLILSLRLCWPKMVLLVREKKRGGGHTFVDNADLKATCFKNTGA